MAIKRLVTQANSRSPLINRKKTETRKGRDAIIAILSIIMIFSGSLFYVWTRLEAYNFGYKISRAEKDKQELLQLNRSLQLEVATLKAPERVARITQELGMVVPRREQIIVVRNYGH